jgi:integral membrane protein
VTPLHLFRRLAIAEAVTWALLLAGMFVKYAVAHHLGELGVRVLGMVHGVVFVAYCLGTVVVAVDQRWTARRTLLGLVASVPPFLTVWFDRYAERHDALAPRWRLRDSAPARTVDRPVAWLLRNPLRGAAAGLVAVLVLTGVALLAGPPVG